MNNELFNEPRPGKIIDAAKTISFAGAQPNSVLIHDTPGRRFANVLILWANALGMTLFAIFFPDLCKPFPIIMPLWGIAALLWGLYQRHLRWVELRRGEFCHSYSSGTTRLASLKFWPKWLTEESRLIRFVEPALLWLVGLVSMFVLSRAFGVYLMGSSVFMATLQEIIYQTAISQLENQLDSTIYADAQSRVLGFFTNKSLGPAPTAKELEGVAVATGVSRDLMAAIERKRAKKFNAPDNLAPART